MQSETECSKCNQSLPKEDIYEVYWEGPFNNTENKNKAWKLYAIYTSHPIYGASSLTYIGKAKNGVIERLNTHIKKWFSPEHVGGTYYAASIYKFTGWDNSPDWKNYDNCLSDNDDAVIKHIEELLIFALQPAYNSTSKQSANKSGDIRLFNTGAVGAIPQEISGKFNIE